MRSIVISSLKCDLRSEPSFVSKVLGASFHSTTTHTSRKFQEFQNFLEDKLWIENYYSCGRISKLWIIYVLMWNLYVPCVPYVPSCGTHMSHVSQVVEHICPICPKLWKFYFKLFSSSIRSFQVSLVIYNDYFKCYTFHFKLQHRISSCLRLFQVVLSLF